MAWAEQWSIKVDGTEVNDRTNFWTQIPQIFDVFDQDAILVPIDGDYPSFIRLQPREGVYSILTQMTACDWATFYTRLATLKAIYAPGVHTLTVQVRGMPAALAVTIVTKGMAVEAVGRRVSVATVVPKPVLA